MGRVCYQQGYSYQLNYMNCLRSQDSVRQPVGLCKLYPPPPLLPGIWKWICDYQTNLQKVVSRVSNTRTNFGILGEFCSLKHAQWRKNFSYTLNSGVPRLEIHQWHDFPVYQLYLYRRHNQLQILDRPATFFAKCKVVLQVQRHSALRKENQL